ncbi:hypothetical protein PG993_006673 [Apiospora rasikravindrae]|uniref:Uncharacterized protein n=1 Tax=Apiospora rasikravindrae TaxID=990691 RepID=A0ABR1T6C8_9PEZI
MCECKVKTYTYEACQHRSKTRVLCLKASWRAMNFLCLGPVLTKCRPKKESKVRNGLCTQCTHHFLPYHINDRQYVKKYLKWKADNGYAGRKIDARIVPFEAIFNIDRNSNNQRRKAHHQQSPMVATNPYHRQHQEEQQQQNVDSFYLAAEGALDSGYYAGSSARSQSPAIRDARTNEPVDLSDLTERVNASLAGSPFKGRAHAGGKMMALYLRSNDNSSAEIKETLLSPCNERKLRKRCMLNPAPRQAHWRSAGNSKKGDKETPDDGAKRDTYYVTATPSLKSSTGFVGHVRSRSHTAVPVPPPQPFGEIFMGCDSHGQARRPGCASCTEAYFRERGVPDETYIRECHSAPPCLVRVRTPGDRYTCAPQASCICERYGRENCLACFAKAHESKQLQANFI